MDSNKNKFIRFKEYLSPEHHHHHSMRESFESGKIRGCLIVVQRGWNKGCEMMRKSFIQRRRRQPSSSKSSELDQAVAQIRSNTDEKHNNVIKPNGNFLPRWNKGMLILCLFALALDPLFFYIPVINLTDKCLDLDKKMQTAACILRTIVDVFYVSHIVIQFHTGFIPRSSQVFGRGDLVYDRFAIARRYLSSYFFVDILAILPAPQIMLLWVIPLLLVAPGLITKESLKFIILGQGIPRIVRIRPIYKQVKSTSGFLTQTPWAGAAFNLFLYMLASHAAGAFWYLISIERQDSCWHDACNQIKGCLSSYLYCDAFRPKSDSVKFIAFMNSSCPLIKSEDITDSRTFDFGIFIDALSSRVVESKIFFTKLFYCFWWGFRNLSSLGQNLKTSLFVGEILFATGLSIAGLVLFALLIGNMQTYLQSISVRIEEMRVKRRDAELWMSHRMLPDDMKKRVRRYEQDKWQHNRGVDEEGLIKNLPKDLRRDIKRHLCLTSLMRVPMFKKMDEQLIDAMCDRLKPVLFTENSTIVREGDTVDEILFIIRGKAVTKTTNYGGIQGFFHTDVLELGYSCGEELMTWALDPNSTLHHLPTSTQTVYTTSHLEAFALKAEDFKFIASQFSQRLHSKQLQHAFRFHSPQWKTWGACCIQAAWRNYIKRKKENALREAEEPLLLLNYNIITNPGEGEQGSGTKSSSPTTTPIGASINAIRFVPHLRRTLTSNISSSPGSGRNIPPQKPDEPNFGIQ